MATERGYREWLLAYRQMRLIDVSYFFFSSRRRHTRSLRDWSSDVCSSDLPPGSSAPDRAWCGLHRETGPCRDWRRSPRDQIGRASCRERAEMPVAAASGCSHRRNGRTCSSPTTSTKRSPLSVSGTSGGSPRRWPPSAGIENGCWPTDRCGSSTYRTFFFQAEDGIRDLYVTGVQTCALPIYHQIVAHQIELGVACIGKQDLVGIGDGHLATRSEERRVGKERRCRSRQLRAVRIAGTDARVRRQRLRRNAPRYL